MKVPTRVEDLQRFVKSYLTESIKTLREGYAAIVLSIITDILAGIFLGRFHEILRWMPGLIVLIPGAIALRGNIFGSLGSRLGSGIHLGLIDKFELRNSFVIENVKATLYLTILFSILLGAISSFLCKFVKIECIGIEYFVVISLFGGLISGIIMLVLTFLIAFVSSSKGYDPDNVTTPLITALGDFFTVPSIIVSAILVGNLIKFNPILIEVLWYIVILVFIGNIMYVILREGRNVWRIVCESSAVLVLCSFLGSISGILIEYNLSKFLLLPSLLVMIPAFLEEGGNIGSILASRLSSRLHLGLIEPEFKLDKNLVMELISSFILCFCVFPLVGIMNFISSKLTNLQTLNLIDTILLTTISGVILTIIISLITVLLSFISYRRGYDPDNILIPIVTSTADILGIMILIFTFDFLFL
ncbi:MAG: hypothetical protein DRO95_04545 [Candidatus Altiarchaeales archaeon]|nr:MAG: hypothetical protein DRO95_04545 [Candidatus Altiarchaeales archaeon]